MADRIERYLGRLESELEGRVSGDRLEGILVEVEGHLRESEEAYRELGEPDELANRLAVEGFGGMESLAVKIKLRRKDGAIFQKVWGSIAYISTLVLVVGLVIVSTLISSMNLSMVVVILPGCLCFLAAFFGRAKILRHVGFGFLSGIFFLLLVFLPLGRASITNRAPVLGLSLGNAGMLYHGNVHTSFSTRMEYQRAQEMVQVSEKHISLAHDGPSSLFYMASNQEDGKVLVVNVYGNGYSYKYSKDIAQARESWLKHGDAFLSRMREQELRAADRHKQAWEMEHGSFGQRVVPVLVSLAMLVGGAGALLGIAVGIGLAMRKFVDLVELMMKKVRRYGIQK